MTTFNPVESVVSREVECPRMKLQREMTGEWAVVLNRGIKTVSEGSSGLTVGQPPAGQFGKCDNDTTHH